ncbi:MAG: hypothetical protein ABIH85_07300 [Candidatus Omnitrophota bacterium]
MAKKSLSLHHQRGRVRWEFLRRNEKYAKDFKDKVLSDGNGIYLNFFHQKNSNTCNYFKKEYGIHFVINPKYSYEQLQRILTKMVKLGEIRDLLAFTAALFSLGVIDLEAHIPDFLCPGVTRTGAIIDSYLLENDSISIGKLNNKVVFLDTDTEGGLDKYPFLDKYDGDVSKICIEVDLSLPKPEVMEDLEKEVAMWKELYRRNNKKRSRYDMYETYLQIYDLKKKNTYSQIAEIAYPQERESLDSTIQKVKRNYKAAKKLIEGGYMQIR